MISLPAVRYPTLSNILPAMAPEEIQRKWSGGSGSAILSRTATFVRQLSHLYATKRFKTLEGINMLDFGCGYGRMLRLM